MKKIDLGRGWAIELHEDQDCPVTVAKGSSYSASLGYFEENEGVYDDNSDHVPAPQVVVRNFHRHEQEVYAWENNQRGIE